MFTFAAPTAAWLFALLLPLAAFFFLKLRRPRQEISSLALWQQVLNDARVNSPFQRFKRNILLLLQLLLLALLALAATQPIWHRGPTRAHRLPVLIDCSASMAALDKPGGTSRLDEAKRRVRELIEHLLPDQEICLISFAQTAHKLTGFTDDTRALRAALDAIRVEDVPGSVEDALRLAQALNRTTPFDETLLLSDGNFPAQANFDLSFKLNFQRLPPGGPNLGIVACNARRPAAENRWEIFVEVAGSPDAHDGAQVELRDEHTVLATERITASTTGGKPSARLSFRVDGNQPMTLQVRLVPDGFDALAADNTVFLTLPAIRPLTVYAAPTLGAWRHALRALDGIHVYPPDDPADRSTPPAVYDLAVVDQPDIVPVNTRTVCTVGFVPGDLEKLLTVEPAPSGVVDWRRDAPLLQHVELADLVLSEQPTLRPNVTDGDLANAGYDALIQGTHGPLLLAKRDGAQQSVHWLFHPDRSTLPYRVGFPVFIANLVQSAMRDAGLSDAEAAHTGALAPLGVPASRVYEIVGPAGGRAQASSDEHGILSGVNAPVVGEYRVLDGGTERARVGVGLLSVAETSLEGVDTLRFSEQLSVAAQTTTLRTDRPVWFPLALGAFGLLLFEWWFYQRRAVARAR